MPETAELVATSVDRVLKVNNGGKFETLLKLKPEERALLAREGRHVGIMTHSLHDVVAFAVAELDLDDTVRPLGRKESPLHFH